EPGLCACDDYVPSAVQRVCKSDPLARRRCHLYWCCPGRSRGRLIYGAQLWHCGAVFVSSALGLAWCPWFYRDIVFAGAMVGGVGFWLGLWLCFPVHPITLAQVLSPTFLSLVVGQPVLEELLFRGYCQGQLHQQSWGQQGWCGLTVANGLTSLLFV